ncbi:hypothetical protein ONS95_010578 [Cadophora gregata]|uniref:uncharacterized protein n=1 Tax=Cadophora gregata TaxID=51156 RepID=UPI0026DD5E87|nr:uncharacterized protein ONS95_010578 [Cadophora gregata]KAK0122337.1 hypothetical protein ONS95_010578 [Cadophora gregata]KAK0127815.1 hypothetical protein ONS96_007318 [Cadophora gregata f. sp. sojae]
MLSISSNFLVTWAILLATFVACTAAQIADRDLKCSPGGNFDLSKWNLQLPTGSPGSPETIVQSRLRGCDGYSSGNFYTNKQNGHLVMTVPGSPAGTGCVTTPNSIHCRTEFREISPGSFDTRSAVNRLKVTLSVPVPDDSARGTVVSQILISQDVSKPATALFYRSDGHISIGVQRTRAGGELAFIDLADVPVGNTWTYEIRFERGQLSVAINNGPFRNLDQRELNNPPGYFKFGNYNQGNSYSEVQIHSFSVSHADTAPTSATGGPLATMIRGGIGPHQTIYVLDQIIVPPPPFPSPVGPCGGVPTVASLGTVNLRLSYEDNCCHDVETSKIGNFDICHNSNGPFSSVQQAVGKNLFDRGIKVVAYRGRDCTGGSATGLSLSNSQGCQSLTSGDAGFRSYEVTEPPSCASTGPGVQSDTTVTMALFSDFGCCESFQTFKLGNTGTCHDASQGFHGFTQSVGRGKFGWNIHIQTFVDAGCNGKQDSFSLTNEPTCNKNGKAWKSFRIERQCDNRVIPATKNSNTVSLAFYRDGGCCVSRKTDITLGQLGSCHNAGERFGSVTQAVGANMFGRKIHLEVFTSSDCKGSKAEFDLTNSEPRCSASGSDEAFISFRIVGPPPPVCGWRKPVNSNPNTVTIQMYDDSSCCDYNKQTVIGVEETCHNTPNGPKGGILGFGIAPGSSWTKGGTLYYFSGKDCTGDQGYAILNSNFDGKCLPSDDGSINSFFIAKQPPALPPRPPSLPGLPGGGGLELPPPPPTPDPDTCDDNCVSVGYGQQDVLEGVAPTFGTIFYNGCNNVMWSWDGTWCSGRWASGGVNVECDSAGSPTVVTTPWGKRYGNCFPHSEDCSVSSPLGRGSYYQQHCCRPL